MSAHACICIIARFGEDKGMYIRRSKPINYHDLKIGSVIGRMFTALEISKYCASLSVMLDISPKISVTFAKIRL